MFINQQHKPQQPTRLVVLGGSGFVGQAIVKAAQVAAINVVAFNSRDVDLTSDQASTKLEKLLQPHDSLIFAAAKDIGDASDSDTFLKNVLMAQHVAETARRISLAHLIYLSSDAVYPPNASLIDEKTTAAPATLHGAWHRARELLLEKEAHAPFAILRLTAIYGTGDTHNAYGPNRFMRQAIERKTITLFGGGKDMRGHLYIDDAAHFILAAACHQSTGLLNINSGHSIAFHELAAMIAAQTGAKIENAPPRMTATRRHYDATPMMAAFPYLKLTPLEEGINQTLKKMKRKDESN